MKIVIAPDSFKQCLTASQAAAAMAAGVLDAQSDAVVDMCPMADGGEGTVDAVIAATGGRVVTADVFDPLGAAVRARFAIVGAESGGFLPGQAGLAAALQQSEGQGRSVRSEWAVVEMAAASGLALVAADRRDPLRASTYGTGQLILEALETGARRIIVAVGGSATVDGGCGAAQALGVDFLDADGQVLPYGIGGGALAQIADVDLSGRDERLAETQVLVACDVTSPLLGCEGAAVVYGPQKGATQETVERLEAGMTHLAEMIQVRLGLNVASLRGAGAAGGLAAGLVAFAGAQLNDGLEMIATAVNLPRRLAGADLCITGEGCFDAQSATGKTPVGVARLADEAGVPTVCICGQLRPGGPTGRFQAIYPLAGGTITPQAAINQAQALLQDRSAQAVRDFQSSSVPTD